MSAKCEGNVEASLPVSSVNDGVQAECTPHVLALNYDDLPSQTSIRVLQILDGPEHEIHCMMQVVDLEDDPRFASLSYTWGNPITVNESPMPDLDNIKYPEEMGKLPFSYSTPPLGPDEEQLVCIDATKRDYLGLIPNIPYEHVAWKSGPLRTIYVDDHTVQVEENLFKYLKALGRMKLRFSQEQDDVFVHLYDALQLPLFIDAICINQSNLSERVSQVQLMGRIYKSASKVFAWIGPSDNFSNIAFSAFDIILAYESTRSKSMEASEDNSPEDISLSSISGMTVAHWFALFAFLQRLWFRRAWIAQEAIFSQNLNVICGENLVVFDLLLTVFSVIEEIGLSHELCHLGRRMLTGEPLSEQCRHLAKLTAIAKAQEALPIHPILEINPRDSFAFVLGYHRVRGRLGLSEAGPPMLGTSIAPKGKDISAKTWNLVIPETKKLNDYVIEEVKPGHYQFHKRPVRLLSILSSFRNLDATDPRDQIFAFLNLATDNLGLVPNYRASVQDVFREATEIMMTRYDSLAILSHVQEPLDTKTEGLPGWVPDFSVRLGRTPFDTGDEMINFLASGRFGSTSTVVELDGSLVVQGVNIDTVSTVTDLQDDAVSKSLKLLLRLPVQYPVEPYSWWSKSYENNSRRELIPKAITRVEALWRTLIADNLTEVEEDYGNIDSKPALVSGFINWIIVGILDARSLLVEYIDLHTDFWATKLIHQSFCTILSLWSAVYDQRQASLFSDIPSLEEAVRDLSAKARDEKDQYQLAQHLEIPPPSTGIEHFPTANQISASFKNNVAQSADGGDYKAGTLERLTRLERRQLRNFEKHMRNVTDGRHLFSTHGGLLGLGPKSTSGDAVCPDEIWILKGARVPFILRPVDEASGIRRYRIVGEAYVHGVMYGEMASRFYDDDDWEYDEDEEPYKSGVTKIRLL